ncbi:MAG TPA: hypothetical protein VFA49_10290, partial [Chloroflexota bacterium]|nr:hypothetical protein [Chloroflexota bacterium]
GIGQVITQINDYQTAIASAVEEQTATTSQINYSIAEVAGGAREIAASVTTVAGGVEQTTSAAATSEQTAKQLTQTAVQLREVVTRFHLGNDASPAAAVTATQGC